jgi:exopolysaccharide production protein ExoZ
VASLKKRSELSTVQALRGVAALLVVAFHAVNTWAQHALGHTTDEVWPNGSAGVDIFFVISGLVMVLSADRLAGRPGASRTFVRQRLVRIVPLYWVMTTAKIAAVLAVPSLVLRTRLDLPYVVGSYLFLPVRDSAGDLFPVLPVGWTLTYEMLFYALVSLALLLRWPILAVAGPALGAFVVAAIALGSDGFANTIVAEFLFGVLIGIAVRRGLRLPPAIAFVLLCGGFAVLLTGPVVSGVLRPLTWGVPAWFIVAGAVALEDRLAPKLPGWLLDAGDASYSIYLMHLFVIPLVYICVARLVPDTLWLPFMVVGSLLASAAVGRLGYICIERPFLHWLRRPPVAPNVAIAG